MNKVPKQQNLNANSSNDLYRKMHKLWINSVVQEGFVRDAKNIFLNYLKSSGVNYNAQDKELNKSLDEKFATLYQKYNKRKQKTFTNHFVGFLNDFAQWIGIKDNKAKKIIENTVEIIKVNHEVTEGLKELKNQISIKIQECKDYNLLNNLINDGYKNLTGQNLKIFYNLVVLEPAINLDYSSIDIFHSKINTDKSISAEQMIQDIDNVLNYRNSELTKINVKDPKNYELTQSNINLIKCMKTDGIIERFKGSLSNIKELHKEANKDLVDSIKHDLGELIQERNKYLYQVENDNYEARKDTINKEIKEALNCKINNENHDKIIDRLIEIIEKNAIEKFDQSKKGDMKKELDKILNNPAEISIKKDALGILIKSMARKMLIPNEPKVTSITSLSKEVQRHGSMSR